MKYIKLKDFTVGQTAYVVRLPRGSQKEPIINERVVASIGRKYVTLDFGDRFLEKTDEFALVSEDWGHGVYLCKTKEDTEKFIKKDSLENWLRNATAQQKTYSFAQLEKVKEILENAQM